MKISFYAFFRLFGGGTKKLLRTASVTSSGVGSTGGQQSITSTPTEEASGPTNWLNKQRGKLNFKILGQQHSVMKEDKPTYREQFVPPEMSMLAYLLTKVSFDVNYHFILYWYNFWYGKYTVKEVFNKLSFHIFIFLKSNLNEFYLQQMNFYN